MKLGQTLAYAVLLAGSTLADDIESLYTRRISFVLTASGSTPEKVQS